MLADKKASILSKTNFFIDFDAFAEKIKNGIVSEVREELREFKAEIREQLEGMQKVGKYVKTSVFAFLTLDDRRTQFSCICGNFKEQTLERGFTANTFSCVCFYIR